MYYIYKTKKEDNILLCVFSFNTETSISMYYANISS